MADAVDGEWPVEVIPDADRVFVGVRRERFNRATGRPNPGAFEDPEQSVYWERYASAADSLTIRKAPSDWGIASLIAGQVRAVEGQEVLHDPDPVGDPARVPPLPPMRAHSLIRGDKRLGTPRARVRLSDLCTVDIPWPREASG